jgi:hypothetical protein
MKTVLYYCGFVLGLLLAGIIGLVAIVAVMYGATITTLHRLATNLVLI